MPVPLPAGVRCFAIAGSRQDKPGAPACRIRGDGLVPVDSALGRRRGRAAGLGLPDANCRILYGTGHFDLLGRAAACEAMKRWLAIGA